jgi:hypothetical protein
MKVLVTKVPFVFLECFASVRTLWGWGVLAVQLRYYFAANVFKIGSRSLNVLCFNNK